MKHKREVIYDFHAFGKAIKSARQQNGWTRAQTAPKVGCTARHLMSIENKGQHPSLQVFYELVTVFGISVDQFFFFPTKSEKSPTRRQLENLLDTLDDDDLIIVIATIMGIQKVKKRKDT